MGKKAKRKEKEGGAERGRGMRTPVSLTSEVIEFPALPYGARTNHSGMLSRPPTPLADITEVWILRQHRLPSSNSDPWARVPLVLSSHCVFATLIPGMVLSAFCLTF